MKICIKFLVFFYTVLYSSVTRISYYFASKKPNSNVCSNLVLLTGLCFCCKYGTQIYKIHSGEERADTVSRL